MLGFEDISKSISELAARIVKDFSEAGISLSAAESCTGGMLASAIVSVPHASATFKGSAVCYCDYAKMRVLKVPSEILEEHFAESAECAIAMARGAMEVFSSDIAVATTGFLDSNVGNKPASLAGCAFVAVASRVGGKSQKSEVRKIVLDTSAKRNYNRALVVEFALKQLVGFER